MQAVTCSIKREIDVYVAIGRGRELSAAIGFGDIDRTRIEIVILELARNLVVHAGGGTLIVAPIERDGRTGFVVESHDTGPGIPDIALAMRDGYSTARTLGAGLPGVQRLMDEFSITSVVGEGTHICATKWLPRRTSTTREGRSR